MIKIIDGKKNRRNIPIFDMIIMFIIFIEPLNDS